MFRVGPEARRIFFVDFRGHFVANPYHIYSEVHISLLEVALNSCRRPEGESGGGISTISNR